jgi:hypothetical protein
METIKVYGVTVTDSVPSAPAFNRDTLDTSSFEDLHVKTIEGIRTSYCIAVRRITFILALSTWQKRIQQMGKDNPSAHYFTHHNDLSTYWNTNEACPTPRLWPCPLHSYELEREEEGSNPLLSLAEEELFHHAAKVFRANGQPLCATAIELLLLARPKHFGSISEIYQGVYVDTLVLYRQTVQVGKESSFSFP